MCDVIDELARAGITHYRLKGWITEKPKDVEDYETLANDLWWFGNELPGGRPHEPLGGWP